MPFAGPDTITAIAAIVGNGLVLQWLKSRADLKAKRQDEPAAFRAELHARMQELQSELKEARAECQVWRDRYNQLYLAGAMLRAAAELQRLQLRELTGEDPPALPAPQDKQT